MYVNFKKSTKKSVCMPIDIMPWSLINFLLTSFYLMISFYIKCRIITTWLFATLISRSAARTWVLPSYSHWRAFSTRSLRFFQRVWWSIWLRKIFQDVLCPTQLFWKPFNQHCLSYKISNLLQFNSHLFFWKLFETVLHWHTCFQHVPHVENTFKYINAYASVFCRSV